MRVAITSCGKTKEPVTCRASEMYISAYSQDKKALAQRFFDEHYILSAWYGLVPEHLRIQPYDAHISEVDQETWLSNVIEHLKHHKILDRNIEIWSLCPKSYHQAGDDLTFRQVLEQSEAEVVYPFDATGGIGYQRQWMGDCLEQDKLIHPREGDYRD